MFKSAIKRALVGSGLDRVVRALAGGSGAILMLHRVGEPRRIDGWSATDGLAIGADTLDRFIDTLQGEGYELITVSQALERLRAGGTARRFAALTFDDGYLDNHQVLLPLLARRGARATVYVSAGFIDRTAGMWWFGVEEALARNDRVVIRLPSGPRWFPAATTQQKSSSYEEIQFLFFHLAPEQTRQAIAGLKRDHGVDCLAYTDALSMSWQQVRAMDQSGVVEIGGHAIDHSPLAAMDEAEARAEITEGRARIGQGIGRAPRSFAYPYGTRITVSPRDIALVQAAGYTSAVTTQPRPVTRDDAAHPFILPRIGLGGNDDWRALRVRLAGMNADHAPYAA
ncbi:MAG: polysaccharide deacetylase family protein [Alphaproteobacteria bacterium]|nr:polysaccharide deacetylase family protein [Alphaproteobacteria bacterium]